MHLQDPPKQSSQPAVDNYRHSDENKKECKQSFEFITEPIINPPTKEMEDLDDVEDKDNNSLFVKNWVSKGGHFDNVVLQFPNLYPDGVSVS